MKLILASASPRRRELLSRLGIPFEICACDVDEKTALLPRAAVVCLAERKARAAAEAFHDGIVIGADTLVSLDDRALGKPKDRKDAVAMLRALSGNLHEVYTGVCLLDVRSGRVLCRAECTKVRFRDLSEAEIASYVDTGEPMDKAGAYGAQGIGALFVEGITGDFFNVMGLPLCRLSQMLEKLGVNLI